MDQDREELLDYRLDALLARGDTPEDWANVLGTSPEAIRQRVSRFRDRAGAPAPSADDDPRIELSDALAVGDEIAFFDTISENPELFRWINPAALSGAEELRAFHAEQVAQLTAGEDGQPSMAECVTVVLPSDPSPMASVAMLQAVIPRAKRLVLISTRASLRALLAVLPGQ